MNELTPSRILDLPLAGVQLVEASAGSGKTWTLAGLHLRALLDGRNVDEVLVVTFTNAATEELRGRIRERLRACLAALAEGSSADPLLGPVAERHAGDAALVRRLRDAVGAMDEAAVHTIHGFCQRVLTEHAFATGAPFDATWVDDETEHQQRVARALWREVVLALPPVALHALRGRWSDPDALLGGLEPPFTREVTVRLADPRGHDEWAAELARRHSEAAALWARDRGAVVAAAQTLERDRLPLKKGPYKDPGWAAVALEAVEAFVSGTGAWPEALRASVLRTHARANAEQAEALERELHPLFELGDAIADATSGLLHAFERWVRAELRARYARYRAERGLVTHDDVLARVRDALAGRHGGALARDLARRWPVALVDEFQDTDPVQYAILRALAAAGQAQVLVGDPKQAIYAFRGADVFAYLTARRDTDPARRHVLRTNWRSTPAMVAATNALFDRPGAFVLDDIPFTPAVAGDHDSPLSARLPGVDAALELWRLADDPAGDGRRKDWSKDAATARIAAAVASHIVGLLEAAARGEASIGDRPLAARDIAVLTRTHPQAEAVRAALAARGVGAAYAGKERVFETAEAAELEPLIAAAADPDDPAAVRRALASGLIGWSPEELAAELEVPTRWDGWLERFATWQRAWREHGFLPMFHRMLAGLRLSERLMARGDGERALTNLLHLAELTQRAAREHHGAEELLAWYRRERRSGGGGSDEQLLRLESDESLVRIQTVHGAKGLQFPIVYVPFAWDARDPDRPPRPAPLHHDDDGRLVLDYASQDALDRAGRERRAEDVRLLYVALTRAVHHTFVPCGRIGRAYGHSALAWLLHGGGTPDDLDAPLERLAARAGRGAIAVRPLPEPHQRRLQPDRGQATRLQACALTRVIRRDWRVTSYSGLVRGEHTPLDRDAEPGVVAAPPPSVADVFALPRGVRLGNCVHALLEALDLARADEGVIAAQAERLLPRFGLDAGLAPIIGAWIARVLRTPLPPGIALADLAPGARVAELEFWYRLDPFRLDAFNATLERHGWEPLERHPADRLEGLLNGQVDLVFGHAGRWYVVDYKTNWLGDRLADYRGDALDAAMRAHRYDLQYLIYLLALDAFLARRLAGYDPAHHLGGALYLFLRGIDGSGASGIWSSPPPLPLIAELRALLQHGGRDAA